MCKMSAWRASAYDMHIVNSLQMEGRILMCTCLRPGICLCTQHADVTRPTTSFTLEEF